MNKKIRIKNILKFVVIIAVFLGMAYQANTLSVAASNMHQIVFIDSSIEDANVIKDSIKPGIESVYINANSDGIKQMSNLLKNRNEVDIIHIISHGTQGKLYLGTGILSSDSLSKYSEELKVIKNSLSKNGEIFLYGCDIAKGDDGKSFVEKLAKTTGASVAASNDETGSVKSGGNWNLEVRAGNVSADNILSFPEYKWLLDDTYNFNNVTIQADSGGTATVSAQVSDLTITVSDSGGAEGWPTASGNGDGWLGVSCGGYGAIHTLTIQKTNSSLFYPISVDVKVESYNSKPDILTVKGYNDSTIVATKTYPITANMTDIFKFIDDNNKHFNNITKLEFSMAHGNFFSIRNLILGAPSIAVAGITVSGTDISTKSGTSQMSVAVTPTDATNKSVTWTVTEADGTTATDKATIDASGVLKAVKDGKVRVKATAKDGSNAYGTKDITITNNPILVSEIAVSNAENLTSISTKSGTLQMSAVVSPTDAANKLVTWAVTETNGSTTDKASISTSGLLTAVKNGTVVVKATAKDGSNISGIKNITITNNPVAVSTITVSGAGSATSIDTKSGALQMTAIADPTDATDKSVTWTVTEPDGSITDKATINASGLLTAVKNGKVTVKAIAKDGSNVYGTKEITITNNSILVTQITVNSAEGATGIDIKSGTLQMSASVEPADATDKSVTWTVTEPDGSITDKATIDANGLLKAVKNGKVTVKAIAKDGSNVYDIKEITITNNPVAVSTITVSGAGNAASIGTRSGTLQMSVAVIPADATDKSVTWAVTEPDGSITDKATINASGLLTAVKNGKVLVKAIANDGTNVYGTKEITITNNPVAVSKITVGGAGSATSIDTKSGALQMTAIADPTDATDKSVTWTVTEPDGSITDKATINASGLLTAVKNGKVLVKATANDGTNVYGTKEIIITNNPVAVSGITVGGVGNVAIVDTKSGTLQMTATVQPTDATNQLVTWSVTEADGTTTTDKAAIDADGLLKAVKNGKVTVKAIAKDGSNIYGTKEITITNNPVALSGITVSGAGNATSIDTRSGALQMITTANPTDATDKSVTWTVTEPDGSATDKATIDANGLLKAVKNGTVTVKAIAKDGSNIYGTKEITIANNPVAVSKITVGGAGNATSIDTKSGALQMTATADPTDATDKSVTWTVTEPDGSITDKATIDANGLLKAVKNGTVTVKAIAKDGSNIYGTKEITITNNPVAVSKITVSSAGNATSIDIKSGTLQMTAAADPADATNKSVTWTVTEPDGSITDKATIDADGLLKAVKNGKVTVKAIAKDESNVYGTKEITITNNPVAASAIIVSSEGNTKSIDTKAGTLQMLSTVTPADATDKSVTWEVTETDGATATDKATIDANGLLKAVKNGTVTVKAIAKDGSNVYGTKEITITNNPVAVSVITVSGAGDATSIDTKSGALQMSVAVIPADATDKSVTWTVTEPDGSITDKATIDATAQTNGTVIVRATAKDGSNVSGSKEITISGQFVPVNGLILSSNNISENTPKSTTVGIINSIHFDKSNTSGYADTFSLVSGTGDTDNSKFTIEGNVLKTADVFDYESKNSYSIRVKVTDAKNNTLEKSFTINVLDVNEAPTDITLASNAVDENSPIDTAVGKLTPTDPDKINSFTYSLVSGEGDTDNSKFAIQNDTLKTAAIFDYETKNSYKVRIRVVDNGGLSYEKAFTININDVNEPITDVLLSNSDVLEKSTLKTSIGSFTSIDPDANETSTYSFVSGKGDTDNSSFLIEGNTLKTAADLDYDTKNSYSIRVKATDSKGNAFEKQFTVNVKHSVLTNLAVSNGTLTPQFAEATKEYKVAVPNNISSIKVTPASNDSASKITVNDTAVVMGSQSQDVNLNVGVNTIAVKVTSSNGTVKTYTITVTRAESDQKLVADAKEVLTVGYAAGDSQGNVTQSLNLAEANTNGASITWTSSDTSVIDNKGRVQRPNYILGDKQVTLTAKITKGEASDTKTFVVTVKKQSASDLESVNLDKESLNIGYVDSDNQDSVTQDITLPLKGVNGSSIIWISNNPFLVGIDGKVSRPSNSEGNQGVTLTALITKGFITVQKSFALNIICQPMTNQESVNADKSLLNIGYAEGDSSKNVTQNVTLALKGLNGSTITWKSSNPGIITNDGIVKRPLYTAGDKLVTIKAVITKGQNTTEKMFVLNVIKQDISDEEEAQLDKSATLICYAIGDCAESVKQNIILPNSGEYGSSIKWESSNEGVISVKDSSVTGKGIVIRPNYTKGNINVNLKATITNGKASTTRDFILTVKKLPYIAPIIFTKNAVINESVLNDGSLEGTQVITTIGGKFADNLQTGDVLINNLPMGIDYTVTRDSDTQATIKFTGKALRHNQENSLRNVSVTVSKNKLDGAITDISSNTFAIKFISPVKVFISKGEVSGPQNPTDGKISDTIDVNIINGVFADDISNSDVTVNNLPKGLGISVSRLSDTSIRISFTGEAEKYKDSQGADVGNASITISKAKIIGSAQDYTTKNFKINFDKKEAVLTVAVYTLAESDDNDGTILGTQTVNLLNASFAQDITISDVMVVGLPAGITLDKVKRISDTQLELSFKGKAVNNDITDNKNSVYVRVKRNKLIL
jgi:uncharacterized protein YjdB